MTVWRLVRKEIRHRRLNFALAVLSVVVAVGVLTAEVTLLRAHDIGTEQLLAEKQHEADERLAVMEDDYRKYMKELGFNLLILPKKQNLTEFWEAGYASNDMPEEFVKRLSDSGTESMRHLLPLVQQKVLWPEQKRRIILIGTRGEVPIKYRRPKEPMLLAVPVGKVVVGHDLAGDLELAPGDPIKLLGREFVVESVRPQRGTAEDATIWMDLAAAQKLLKMEGRINAIEALKCHCAGHGVDMLRQEVLGVLPETKVVVRENKVTIRAKARSRARTEHEAAMASEKAHRASLRRSRESFAAVLVPLVILAAAVWIALLALVNVRERSAEIGILRAIGVRSRQVFTVFLAKAVLVGLVGAALGYGGGLAVGILTARSLEQSLRGVSAVVLFVPTLPVCVVLAAPLLSAAACWAPAIVASRQDPAVILSKE